MKTMVAVAKGRVQGVGYRAFVIDHARALGLSGWVRNTPQGHVEVEAQGADEDLERLEGLMRRGPNLSHVTMVDVVTTDRPAYHGFDIRW